MWLIALPSLGVLCATSREPPVAQTNRGVQAAAAEPGSPMVANVEKATSPQTVRVALELDVPRTRPSSAASTRTTMSPQKQLRPQSASPALTRGQQQRNQVLGWRAYVADPRIFNDAAIGAKARAANSVPALWQASLRRVDVRSILKKESNIAP